MFRPSFDSDVPSRKNPNAFRPQLEHLAERIVPAFADPGLNALTNRVSTTIVDTLRGNNQAATADGTNLGHDLQAVNAEINSGLQFLGVWFHQLSPADQAAVEPYVFDIVMGLQNEQKSIEQDIFLIFGGLFEITASTLVDDNPTEKTNDINNGMLEFDAGITSYSGDASAIDNYLGIINSLSIPVNQDTSSTVMVAQSQESICTGAVA